MTDRVFDYLADMPTITVSLPMNRWYFHHRSSSQFSPFYETMGFADAAFVSSAAATAPSIVKPPTNQSIGTGGTVAFNVAARGTGPLGYQWLIEDAPLSGATNSALTLTNVGTGQAGRYSVRVSNALGSVTSAAATLRVIPSVTVSVFDDPNFVYTSGGPYAHSDSVQASIERLGHRTIPFTDVNAAAAGNAPLLFPAFEAGDLAPTLTASTRDALQGFVARGGVLIVHGVNNDPRRPARFLNTVFGFTLEAAYPSTPFPRTGMAAGTAFADDSASLPLNDQTRTLLTASLPVGARNIYGDAEQSVVTLFSFGSGRIIFLGWNWSGAVPLERQDGGWLTVLESAIEETAPPAPSAPVILSPPLDLTVVAGSAARLRVLASGFPLSYQWLFNGQPLSEATNYVLQLDAVTTNRTGSYSVVVSTGLGFVTSARGVV